MRILVIEDEAKIASFIKKGLTAEGYAVDLAVDGKEGLIKSKRGVYDLIILDLMLPKINGIEVCNRLRQAKIESPVIMLTAKDTIEDKIEGLDAGADDYLTKPFAFKELVARARALLRRKPGRQKKTVMEVGPLKIDTKKHLVYKGKIKIDLSAKEFGILEYMAHHAGEVVSRTQLIHHIWDQNYNPFSNIVDVYIRYLRQKIKDDKGRIIETVRGSGYRLKND